MTRTISWSEHKQEALTEAIAALERGGVIGLPTETVYGLATRAGDDGVARLRAIKGRDEGKPFTLAVASAAAAHDLPVSFPSSATKLARRFWPGPITLALPRIDGHGELIGVRVPGSPIALEVLTGYGAPVLLTSLNRSGDPPALNAAQVPDSLRGRLDLLIDGGESPIKEASTVVRFWPIGLQVDREGILTRDIVLKHATHHFLLLCSGNTCRSPMAAALLGKLLATRLGVPVSELPSHGIVIASAGLSAHDGMEATPEAVEVAHGKGADLIDHRSHAVDDDDVLRADVILTMTAHHLEDLRQRYPGQTGKMHLLDPTGRDVVDPIGGTLMHYQRAAEQIENALEQWLVKWGFER